MKSEPDAYSWDDLVNEGEGTWDGVRNYRARNNLRAMKVGDKVVTSGGIHGRIKEVGETWFLVEVADGVKIKFEKASVFASSADVTTP